MKESCNPKIITICGSTRFKEQHLVAVKKLTMDGNIVLSCPFYNHADDEKITDEDARLLTFLHKRKIDMSDSIFVINPGNYIGKSTMDEIIYAASKGKEILYLE